MTKTPDLLRLILLTGAFFETPNQQHQREHLDFVALLHRVHDGSSRARNRGTGARVLRASAKVDGQDKDQRTRDRKSTRLNSSHVAISYAVFCLKKKNTT